MKLPIRILIAMLCAAIILSMPFTLSSPRILDNEKARLMQEGEENEAEDEDSEEIDFSRLFFTSACAEEDGNNPEDDGEVTVEMIVEGELATMFRVSSIPLLVVMKGGKVVNSAVGVRPKDQIVNML